MDRHPHVLPLDRLRSDDLPRVGRKAFGLGELAAAGLPVPAGFCVTTEAYEIAVRPLALSLHDEAGFLAARDRVRSACVSTGLADALARAWEETCAGAPVAVRSSGSMEDLEGASFAGQYETFLNVRSAEAVIDAVKGCWASVFSPRIWTYCAKQRVSIDRLRMGVVVQRLIDADCAGVLFTLDPTSGLDDRMVVESCWGLGEALVSGHVNPDRFVLGFHTGKVLQATVARKERQTVRTDAGTSVVEVPPERRDAPTLDEPRLAQLARLGARVQAHYGAPQDIEWAFADGTFHLLQSRPVTTIAFAADLGEWTTADMRDGGVSSTVCSPFMFSLYDHVWERTMPGYFRDLRLLAAADGTRWGRLHFGRMYWNVGAAKACLHRVPGFNERNFDRDLGIEITYDGDGVVVPVTLMGVVRAIPTIVALGRHYRARLRANEAFLKEFAGIEARFAPAGLDRLTWPDFLARLHALLPDAFFATESAYFNTIYNTSNAKLDFKVELDALNASAARAGVPEFSYLHLISGLTDLSHMRPLHALWDLAGKIHADPALRAQVAAADPVRLRATLGEGEAGARLDALLREFGHHGLRELDITVPRWSEDPSFVHRTLQGWVQEHQPDRDPRALTRKQNDLYAAECRRIEEFTARGAGWRWRPWRRRRFFALLERARKYCWWREEMRDRSTRMYALIRAHALELARRLTERGDLDRVESLWYLSFPDALALADGTLPPREAATCIEGNRHYTLGYRNFANPNEIGPRWQRRGAPSGAPAANAAATGVPCSPGVAEGPARVLPDIHAGDRLRKGDVLVTAFTDPGWTPLLGFAAAVVTETGGLLSHAAVISREYGIPAVLNVPGATRRFKDGQRLRVDGSAGTIEIVEP